MSIKLKFPNIKGDSTDKSFEGWIDVNSFSVSTSRNVRSSNQSGMREIGVPNMSEIQIRKSVCSASPLLLQEVLKGKGQELEFQFLRTTPEGLENICQYKISDALLTSHNFAVNANEDMEESFSISFTKIDVAFKKFDQTGKAVSQSAIMFSLKEMK